MTFLTLIVIVKTLATVIDLYFAYARTATCISKLKKKLGISKAINKEHC